MPSPTLLSQHHHPHLRLRRATTRLIILALITAVVALIIQAALILLLWPAGILFCGTLFFTAILTIPLLIAATLHPEIDVTAEGLYLRPMIGSVQFVPCRSLIALAPHPLIAKGAPGQMPFFLYGRKYRPPEGALIVVARDANLSPVYRLVGGLAGTRYAFAISTTAHKDYTALHEVIARWVTNNERLRM